MHTKSITLTTPPLSGVDLTVLHLEGRLLDAAIPVLLLEFLLIEIWGIIELVLAEIVLVILDGLMGVELLLNIEFLLRLLCEGLVPLQILLLALVLHLFDFFVDLLFDRSSLRSLLRLLYLRRLFIDLLGLLLIIEIILRQPVLCRAK